MAMPIELPYTTCAELLATQEVGRVAVCTADGPRIIPVNFAVIDDSIVFRTTPYSVLGMHAWNSQLAFEVDQIDPEQHSGWSVVATGRGAVVEDDVELRRIQSGVQPRPWAGGQRWLFVRLRWDDLTGRRIGPAVTMAG
ncbi:pyridoxamine 5'-phosphate oxidase family protein [Nocardioides sp.]|uniref:pyridoxamine 5'-phosphate oxidase family protein n=1 Tax=Nocardioides sp. TaxID=35761 RepID=UPI002ED5A859